MSLAASEIVDSKKKLKFVVPNKEIRDFIDTNLMESFYKMTLESTCNSEERGTIIKSIGTYEFTKNLNNNLLSKISFSKNIP